MDVKSHKKRSAAFENAEVEYLNTAAKRLRLGYDGMALPYHKSSPPSNHLEASLPLAPPSLSSLKPSSYSQIPLETIQEDEWQTPSLGNREPEVEIESDEEDIDIDQPPPLKNHSPKKLPRQDHDLDSSDDDEEPPPVHKSRTGDASFRLVLPEVLKKTIPAVVLDPPLASTSVFHRLNNREQNKRVQFVPEYNPYALVPYVDRDEVLKVPLLMRQTSNSTADTMDDGDDNVPIGEVGDGQHGAQLDRDIDSGGVGSSEMEFSMDDVRTNAVNNMSAEELLLNEESNEDDNDMMAD